MRLLTMRGTIHLLAPEDALFLRPWTAPVHEQEIRISQTIGAAREVDRDAFRGRAARGARRRAAARRRRSAPRWPSGSPTYPATQLGQLARSIAPLVQLPPRGCWKGSGRRGLRVRRPLDRADRWASRTSRRSCAATCARSVRRPPPTSRRGRRHPARPGAQGHGRPGPARGRGRQGALRRPDGELADEDAPAPVRLLGTYDNVWLSHAARDRVTDPEARTAWMGGTAPRRTRSSSTAGSSASGGSTTAGSRSSDRCGTLTKTRAVRARRGDRPGRGAARPLSPARAVRDSSAATAATPAVDVRSTSSPSRTATAPAPANAATSSSVSPPSGPTTTTIRPVVGHGERGERRGRLLVQHDGEVGRADQRDDVGRSWPAAATSGSHDRRACLAASRAVARQRASDFAARSPFQTATRREAAHGTIRATPISVSTSTASSPRSPLGSAWTTTTAGSGSRRPLDAT